MQLLVPPWPAHVFELGQAPRPVWHTFSIMQQHRPAVTINAAQGKWDNLLVLLPVPAWQRMPSSLGRHTLTQHTIPMTQQHRPAVAGKAYSISGDDLVLPLVVPAKYHHSARSRSRPSTQPHTAGFLDAAATRASGPPSKQLRQVATTWCCPCRFRCWGRRRALAVEARQVTACSAFSR